MVRRETKNRIVALGISISLIALIVFVLTPPAMAVYVHPGTPSGNVKIGNTVTFTNVNFTIRNAERIIVNYLQFTIYKSSDNSEVAYVRFNIAGTETSDPNSKFAVTKVSDISNIPYSTGGYSYGYDEITGWNKTTYGYGYGYNGSGLLDLTILYKIVYTTQITGTFYAKLLVNSSIHDYVSAKSSTFTVSKKTTSAGGGQVIPGEEEPEEEKTETSDKNINDINDDFGLNLDEPFYSQDTDGDGVDDKFIDPNGVLKSIHTTMIGDNLVFLISTGDDKVPEFFWNPVTDTITKITHSPPTATKTETDYEAETITLTVTVNKEGGWIYIDVDDDYPDYTLTVKNAAGEEISADKIFRENGKIYVLDDPDQQYEFIFGYTLLPPIFSPADGTTFNTSKPSVTITYTETVTITSAKLNQEDIVLVTDDLMIFTFIPETDLTEGTHTLSITVQDGQANTLTSTYTFNVDLPGVKKEEEPSGGIPLWAIVLIIIIIIIIILVFLFKSGYLYIEEIEEEQEVEVEEEPEAKEKKETKKEEEPKAKKPKKK